MIIEQKGKPKNPERNEKRPKERYIREIPKRDIKRDLRETKERPKRDQRETKERPKRDLKETSYPQRGIRETYERP